MCKYCDGQSPENMIWKDGASGDYYIIFQTQEWNDYLDGLDYFEEFINYCPYCGQRLTDYDQPCRTI